MSEELTEQARELVRQLDLIPDVNIDRCCREEAIHVISDFLLAKLDEMREASGVLRDLVVLLLQEDYEAAREIACTVNLDLVFAALAQHHGTQREKQ